MIEMALGLL